MSRLISAMKTDVTVQVRNRLYHIGIAFSVIAAFIGAAGFVIPVAWFTLEPLQLLFGLDKIP